MMEHQIFKVLEFMLKITTQDDAAPAIRGRVGNFSEYVNKINGVTNGAFTYYDSGNRQGTRSGSSDVHYFVDFDASRSSAVYGRAGEIRPKNFALIGVITYA